MATIDRTLAPVPLLSSIITMNLPVDSLVLQTEPGRNILLENAWEMAEDGRTLGFAQNLPVGKQAETRAPD